MMRLMLVVTMTMMNKQMMLTMMLMIMLSILMTMTMAMATTTAMSMMTLATIVTMVGDGDDGGGVYADWIIAGSIGNTVASTCTHAQIQYGSSVMYQCRDDLAYLVPEPMPLGRRVYERDTVRANEWLQWYEKSSRSFQATWVNQGDFEM